MYIIVNDNCEYVGLRYKLVSREDAMEFNDELIASAMAHSFAIVYEQAFAVIEKYDEGNDDRVECIVEPDGSTNWCGS